MSNYHTPVLLQEVIEGLNVQQGKNYIDATIGGGGHSVEIIRRGGVLLGLDVDQDAVEYAKRNIKNQISPPAQEGEIKNLIGRWQIVQGNFRDIERIAKEHGFEQVNGVLFDLGVSSHQLDTPSRGFGWRWGEAALDMRMDRHQDVQAQDIVRTASEEELYEIFSRFGEEELAGPIAHALVISRRLKPVVTSADFVKVVERVVHKRVREKTVARVFQALRIALNDELGALRQGLHGAVRLLCPKGRLVVISFHSLEDRIVKNMFRKSELKILTKTPIRPKNCELAQNVRARSAKLRYSEKL